MDKKDINKSTTESLKTPFTARLKKSKTQENRRLVLQGPVLGSNGIHIPPLRI